MNTGERILFFTVVVIAIVAAVFGIFIGWLTRTIYSWKMKTGRGLLASMAGGIIGCGAGLLICSIYNKGLELDPIRDSYAYQYAKAYSFAVDSLVIIFFFCAFGTIVGAILGNMIAKATHSKRN